MSISRRNMLKATAAGIATLPFLSSTTLAQSGSNAAAPAPAPLPLPPIPGEVPLKVPTAADISNAEGNILVVGPERLELQAQQVMAPASYEFVAGAAAAQWTLRENVRAMTDYRIAARRMRGVKREEIDTRIRLLGLNLDYPIFVNPMGMHGMVHNKAEADTARGAGLAKALFVASGASNVPLETIAQSTTGPKWWQIYYNNDDNVNRAVLLRAKKAGYSAIVLTADALGPGQSDRFRAYGSPLRKDMGQANYDPKLGGIGNPRNQKTDLTGAEIGKIKDWTGLPVIVKGVLRPDDAERFIRQGADAIQVSNHGGRQADGVPAAITALPAIVDAVKGRVPVLMDSGIRRGNDVLRALALGATAVGVGRPVLYGLALGGAQGVQSVLEYMRDDFRTNMMTTNVGKIADISRDLLDVVGENAAIDRDS